MKLPDKIYDVLKWITILVLPALGTFYYTLADTWGFPYPDQVLATVTAAVTCLGAILGVSTVNYNKENRTALPEDDAEEDEE